MASKPVVMVIGASGNVGMATLNALVSSYGNRFDIRAGVRNPQNDEKFQDLKGAINVVQATMGDDKSLSKCFRGVDRLFIVTPGAENRAELTIQTAKFAEVAGVKKIVVVSVSVAGSKSSLFGRQFHEIEASIKSLKVSWTLLRLPIFMENYFLHVNSIVNQSTISMPVAPDKPYTPVAIRDAGIAAAAILADPAKHAGKTYCIISNRHTFGEVCQEFSRQLKKDVHFERQTYEDSKKSMMQAGLPEWQAGGVVELYQLIDNGSHLVNAADLGDFRRVTGMEPTSLADWINGVKNAFQ